MWKIVLAPFASDIGAFLTLFPASSMWPDSDGFYRASAMLSMLEPPRSPVRTELTDLRLSHCWQRFVSRSPGHLVRYCTVCSTFNALVCNDKPGGFKKNCRLRHLRLASIILPLQMDNWIREILPKRIFSFENAWCSRQICYIPRVSSPLYGSKNAIMKVIFFILNTSVFRKVHAIQQ